MYENIGQLEQPLCQDTQISIPVILTIHYYTITTHPGELPLSDREKLYNIIEY